MSWKPAILNYTQKTNGKVGVRSYAGISASDALASGCAYIARPQECMCLGHMSASDGQPLMRIPLNDDDSSYLKTVQKRWKTIAECETGLRAKDWRGSGRAQSNGTSAYGYILPLPNDVFDSDPSKMRTRIEELLTTLYQHDTTDLTYALHRGESENHEQNLHLHIYVRPRNPDGKKWRMSKAELWQWNKAKLQTFGRVLESWGYEIEHTDNGKGQRRHGRDENAVFLRKGESGTVSERAKTFGTALKMRNEGSRTSRWHAGMALRWSAYDSAMNNRSWADALREQGWELCRGSGDRQTWQIRDTATGKAFALRRLFSCREQDVEQYLTEMRTAIEGAQVELSRIKRERPGAIEHARHNGLTFGDTFGSSIGTALQREPMGALMLMMMLPGLGIILAALFVALKGLDDNRRFDEKTLKTALADSWKEEKSLRVTLKEKLSALTQQQKGTPVLPTIRSTPIQSPPVPARPTIVQEKPRIFGAGQASLEQAIRSGDLKTAGKLDKNRDGIADSIQPVDTDGDGVSDAVEYKENLIQFHVKQNNIHVNNEVLQLWDDTKQKLLARGDRKDGEILNYSVTEKTLKKHTIDEIKQAFKTSGREIPKGVLKCLSDTKKALENEAFSETEAYR